MLHRHIEGCLDSRGNNVILGQPRMAFGNDNLLFVVPGNLIGRHGPIGTGRAFGVLCKDDALCFYIHVPFISCDGHG